MSLTTDQQNALDVHNNARRDVNNPPLQWDFGLASQAQQRAVQLAQIQHLVHAPGPGQGENLAQEPGDGTDAAHASRDFLDEKKDFQGRIFNGGSAGHYTQMIWGKSTHLGIGVAVGGDGLGYVCCRYSPAGNVFGQSPYDNDGTTTGGPPGGDHSDVVYLANAVGRGESGFAFYRDIANSHNGESPDSYLPIQVGNAVVWEGQTFSGKFPDNNVFTCTVDADAQSLPLSAVCGTAKNNFQSYTIRKDSDRPLFQKDGTQFISIYWSE